MPETFTKTEFIDTLRSKYPQYNDIEDEQLFQSVLDQYPSYRSQITDLDTIEPPEEQEEPLFPDLTPPESEPISGTLQTTPAAQESTQAPFIPKPQRDLNEEAAFKASVAGQTLLNLKRFGKGQIPIIAGSMTEMFGIAGQNINEYDPMLPAGIAAAARIMEHAAPYVKQVGEQMRTTGIQRLETDPELQDTGERVEFGLKTMFDPQVLGRALGQGLPTMFLSMGSGIAASALSGGNPLAGLGAMFSVGASLEGSLAYSDAREYGLSEDEALNYGTAVGIVNGALESAIGGEVFSKTGVGRVMSRSIARKILEKGGLKTIGGKVARTALIEGATEGAQEITNVLAEMGYKDEVSFQSLMQDPEQMRSVLQRIGESSYGGLLLGGLAGTGLGIQTQRKARTTERQWTELDLAIEQDLVERLERMSPEDYARQIAESPTAADVGEAPTIPSMESLDTFVQEKRAQVEEQAEPTEGVEEVAEETTQVEEVTEEAAPSEARFTIPIEYMPIENVVIDEETFQLPGRRDEKLINTIAENPDAIAANPVIVWQNPDTKQWTVVNGHHTYYGLQQSGRYNQIPVKRLTPGTTLEEARRLAISNNLQRVEQTEAQNAYAYQQLSESGLEHSEIKDQFSGLTDYKVDRLRDLSGLSLHGNFMANLDKTTGFPKIKGFAYEVGKLRQKYPALTDGHESQIFDYLYKYGGHERSPSEVRDFLDTQITRLGVFGELPANLRLEKDIRTGDEARADTGPVREEMNRLNQRRRKIEGLLEEDLTDEAQKQLRTELSGINRELTQLEQEIGQIKSSQFDILFNEDGYMRMPFSREDVISTAEDLAEALRRNVTARGGLPHEVMEQKIKKDNAIASQMKQAQFTLSDFNTALRQHYGLRGPNTEQMERINNVLRGEESQFTIPRPIRKEVVKMRNEIDNLSQRLIDEGVIEGELAAIVEQNMGFYVNRSYRAFDDPKWAEQVPAEIRNKAKAYLRGEYQDWSENQIEALINELLYNAKESGSPIAMLRRGQVGEKDLSILRKRKDIAPEIRELLGEYTDPRANYAKSVMKMASLIANHKFLKAAKQAGMGNYFWEANDPNIDPEASATIEARPGEKMYPLDGLRTYPEIKDAFENFELPAIQSSAMRFYLKANALVKYGKTVGSIQTHIRNLVANGGFMLSQGHLNFGKRIVNPLTNQEESWSAWKTVFASIGAYNNEQFRQYYRRLQELGVVNESVRADELQGAINDATVANIDDYLDVYAKARGYTEYASKAGKKATKVLTDVYRAEDDIWKIFAFENEVARYQKAKPDWSLSQIEERAAYLVRNTYPTYSLVPKVVKKIRRVPVFGTFVSFPWEVYRTIGNTMRVISDEWQDPDLRPIAAQRIAGSLIAATSTGALSLTTAALVYDGHEEKEEAMREFLPPWSENSQLAHLGRNAEGSPLIIDIGFTDPYAYAKKPLMAFMRGEDWQDGLMQAALEAGEPFFGREILFGALSDLQYGQTRDGYKIWHESDDEWTKFTKATGYLWDEAVKPGTIRSLERIQQGLDGYTNLYGKDYDPVLEGAATLTGQRVTPVNIPRAYWYHSLQFNSTINSADNDLMEAITRPGEVDRQEIETKYAEMERRRIEVWEDMRRKYEAARLWDVPEDKLIQLMQSTNMSKANIQAIISGDYIPYTPTDRLLEFQYEASQAITGREVIDFEARRNLIIELAEQYHAQYE